MSEQEIKITISTEVWCFGCNSEGIELKCVGIDEEGNSQYRCSIHSKECRPFLTVQTRGI